MAPLRALGPAVDVVGPMPYVALQQMIDAGNPPGMQNHWKATFIDELPDAAIDAALEVGRSRSLAAHRRAAAAARRRLRARRRATRRRCLTATRAGSSTRSRCGPTRPTTPSTARGPSASPRRWPRSAAARRTRTTSRTDAGTACALLRRARPTSGSSRSRTLGPAERVRAQPEHPALGPHALAVRIEERLARRPCPRTHCPESSTSTSVPGAARVGGQVRVRNGASRPCSRSRRSSTRPATSPSRRTGSLPSATERGSSSVRQRAAPAPFPVAAASASRPMKSVCLSRLTANPTPPL